MAKFTYQGIESLIDSDKEKEAMLEFLGRYWNVQTRGSWGLSKIVSNVFDEGVNYGIAYRERETADRLDGKVYPQSDVGIKVKITQKVSNVSCENQVDYLRTKAKISAKPKGYKKFYQAHKGKDFPEEDEDLEFSGSRLNNTLGATCPGFGDMLKKRSVKYNQDRGRSPEFTLIRAIFTQGMSFGYNVVDQKYDPVFEELKKRTQKALESLDPKKIEKLKRNLSAKQLER
jgi:hypothetical protein